MFVQLCYLVYIRNINTKINQIDLIGGKEHLEPRIKHIDEIKSPDPFLDMKSVNVDDVSLFSYVKGFLYRD